MAGAKRPAQQPGEVAYPIEVASRATASVRAVFKGMLKYPVVHSSKLSARIVSPKLLGLDAKPKP